MDQLSVEEGTELVKFYLYTGSVVQTQRKVKTHFSTKNDYPTRKTIVHLVVNVVVDLGQ